MIMKTIREQLTPREQEVYKLIVEKGYYSAEIAKELNIAYPTAHTHVNVICHKFGVFGKGRLHKLIIDYYKQREERRKMNNCTECLFDNAESQCDCRKSQYYGDYVNEYQICREFKGKEKNVENNEQSDK